MILTAMQGLMAAGGGGGGSDPYWANVVSLLHFDDSGDPWKDEKGIVWSANGAPALDVSNKKFGASSILLNGSSYLSAADAGFAFGTGDFTIEAWWYDGGNANNGIFSNRLASTHAGTVGLAAISGSGYYVQNNDSATLASVGVPVFSFGHVALSKISGVIRFFNNGVLGGTYADTRNLTDATFFLGAYYSASFCLYGNIDEFRVTKGVGRYLSNFTPPASAFPNS